MRFFLLSLLLILGITLSDNEANANDKNWPSLQPSHERFPIDAERTVRLQTNEGTWMSLDVHPDGNTIIFDFMGDLYFISINGGEATQLTKGMAFDSQPRFNHDGTKVVFVSDRSGGENIWIMDVGTLQLTQRTQGNNYRRQSPVFTPDGNYIIAARSGLRNGVPKLRMYHVDGGGGSEFIPTPSRLKMIEPAFGSDDRHLWYSQRTGDFQYNSSSSQYQLGMFDRETGERHTMTARLGSGFRPTLSNDGKWLVYGTRHETETGLRIRNLETGDERWLAYPVQRDDMESRATRDVLPGMAFTPDNKNIITSYGGRIWRIPIEEGKKAVEIPFEIDTEIAIGPQLEFKYPIDDKKEFVARQIRDGVPSPDGTQVAFTVMNKVYVMDLPDGTPRRLTGLEKVEAFPTWSPDGQWIAFSTWDASEGGHIYRMRSNGSQNPQRLTEQPATYQSPQWSKTKDRIVAIRSDNRVYFESSGPLAAGAANELVWIPADGGRVNFIASANRRDNPHFVHEDDRIYLSHPVRGLLSIRWDGTDEQEHLRVVGARLAGESQPRRASVILKAPKGDQALAAVGNDIYAVTIPRAGNAQTVNVSQPNRASFPVVQLTDIGGQFPVWNGDGRTAHWSIGNSFFSYNLDDAVAREREREQFDARARNNSDDENEEDKEKRPSSYTAIETPAKIKYQRDIPEGYLVLRGANVITMNGYEVVEDADLVIHNNRIHDIGKRGEVDIPAGAEIRDVTGRTIMPGFVDTHAHVRPFRNLHQPQIWSFMANLAYGVTTLRDPQTGTTDLLTYADMVESGEILGPRIYQTGPGIFWIEQIRNYNHAANILKRYSKYYDTKTIKMYVAGNRVQRQWILKAAKEQGLMPTTEGSLDMKLNMTQLLDGYSGQEHNFPISPVFQDVIQTTAETQMAYTPTLLVSYGGPFAENYFYATENVLHDPKLRHFTPQDELDGKTRRRGAGWFHEDEFVMDRQSRIVNQIYDAGGLLGVGSHGQLQGLGYHWEVWSMAWDNMDPHKVLQIATIQGARALGLDGDIGSLEKGKMADLLILSEDPLENIRNTNTLENVMVNGRLYNANNLQEEWPQSRNTGNLIWHLGEPSGLPGIDSMN